MLARLHVVPSAHELVAALADACCLTVLRDEQTIDVILPYGSEQGRAELAFFLRAWLGDHPHARLRVLR